MGPFKTLEDSKFIQQNKYIYFIHLLDYSLKKNKSSKFKIHDGNAQQTKGPSNYYSEYCYQQFYRFFKFKFHIDDIVGCQSCATFEMLSMSNWKNYISAVYRRLDKPGCTETVFRKGKN